MSDGSSFNDLISRLDQGHQSAATEVFERFAGRLVALARSRMNPRLLQKVDPEDVAQSALASFFRAHGKERFRFDDWGGLWGLLVTMTLRKCGRRVEEFHAARRDVRREMRQPESEDNSARQEPTDPEPTPVEAAALTEIIEQVMSHLEARGRQVLTLRLRGYTVQEISHEIGRTERTVHRVLDQIKRLLKQRSDSM
jgi:RNA polymerase sigma-70 factor (ECF subfamily)